MQITCGESAIGTKENYGRYRCRLGLKKNQYRLITGTSKLNMRHADAVVSFSEPEKDPFQ